MTPEPWTALILALAAYRVTRLVGWDEFPLVAKARDWITGAKTSVSTSSNTALGLTNEIPHVTTVYRRPTLEHFLTCPFCVGFWITCGAYVAWIYEPTGTLYAAVPFALSGAVGLISKNLDP